MIKDDDKKNKPAIASNNNNNKAIEDKGAEVKKEKHEENIKQNKKASEVKKAPNASARAGRGPFKKRGFKNKTGKDQEEFEQKVIDIARVTRVMAGGKRMRFRACVAVGNKKGKVAIGLAKGADVTIAVTKATNIAKKNFISVPIVNGTIPHEIYQKFGAARILFKPTRKGRGIIAGGVVRIILELAGVNNITSKILGTNNKINNAKCTIEALKNLKRVKQEKVDKKKEEEKNKKK